MTETSKSEKELREEYEELAKEYVELLQFNAELKGKVSVLDEEVAYLREENKKLENYFQETLAKAIQTINSLSHILPEEVPESKEELEAEGDTEGETEAVEEESIPVEEEPEQEASDTEAESAKPTPVEEENPSNSSKTPESIRLTRFKHSCAMRGIDGDALIKDYRDNNYKLTKDMRVRWANKGLTYAVIKTLLINSGEWRTREKK